jgi:hypothetical protein
MSIVCKCSKPFVTFDTDITNGLFTAFIPGMIVDTIITTDKRTPASFLLKPLGDYWEYALRDR